MAVSGEPTIQTVSDTYPLNRNAITMTDLWKLQLRKWNYQCEYLDKWRELEAKLGKELDAIISPVMPTASIRHNRSRYYGYCGVNNILDLTSVVVPVTFADKNIDVKNGGFQPMNDLDAVVQAECKFKISTSFSGFDWKIRKDTDITIFASR